MKQIWTVLLLGSWLPIVAISSSIGAPVKLVVGYAAINARVSPLWIAEEQGYLTKYGLQVEQVYLRGAPTLVAGLASGDIQLGRSGGSATLAAIGAGHDFKIVATFSSHNTYDFIARPNIKRPEDLKGKKISLTSIGGTTWMGVLLWLEHFGLDAQRDHILLQVIGDQNIQAQSVETGIADAAALDGVWSKRLKQKGFTILGEYSDLNQRIVGQAMVVPHTFLNQRTDIVENYLKAEIEALAYALAPKNKAAVLATLMRRLKTDAAGAEEGYQDLLKGVDRKPFPSLDGLRNVQRMLKMRTPKIGEIKAEEVIDARIMRKLDESGFIDRAYAAQGASLK
ncbi:MAG TPA: ABC transporter substrate-binding protein [Terriglobales bacterium]|jgi:ABC-type nitrate/sulfonate/bicarbonate transport system substrate-binding protein|nr:ABC transporter substrate-binding protein [Terriglobales bacterium]